MSTKLMHSLIQQQSLSTESMHELLNSVFSNHNPIQSGALLSLLSAKGITPLELLTCVLSLKEKMTPVNLETRALDLVGTGGDGANTVNISTASAILAASIGVPVIKHGNTSASSQSGSSDVMRALGINIDLSAQKIADMFHSIGFSYCFAPHFHTSLKTLSPIRKQLGIPTVFNLIGPLLNPAQPSTLMLGVYDKALMPLFANTLTQLKIERALIIHGNQTDELTTLGPTDIIEIDKEQQICYQIHPSEYGFKTCSMDALKGGDAQHNAERILACFKGQNCALRDTLALNAGTAAYLFGQEDSIGSGIDKAQHALSNNMAYSFLNQIRRHSHA